MALFAVPVARTETAPVKIAHQTGPDSGRLVLEFGRPVEYAVEQAAPYTFLRFSHPVSGDLEDARRALSRYIAELRLAGGGRVLVMRTAGQPRMTHYRRGTSVVIAWVGVGRPGPAVAEKPAETKPPQNEPAAKPPEPKITEKPAPPPPKVAEKPADPAPSKPADSPKSADPKITEKPTPPRAETPAKPQNPPPETKRADAAPAKPGPNGAHPSGAAPEAPGSTVGPALSVSNDGAETRIALAWPEPIGAAVFRYGDTVWMIFSRRQAFDLAPYQKRLGPGVERLARVEHAQATVLAARLRAGMGARVLRERNVWTVAFKRDQAGPADNDPKIAITRGATEQVTVALAGAETPIRLADPELGGVVFVVPSRAQAAAAGERRFVAFRLLPAIQGAVVEALADGLTVSAEGAAVVIRRSGGLLLSGGPPPGAPAQGQ